MQCPSHVLHKDFLTKSLRGKSLSSCVLYDNDKYSDLNLDYGAVINIHKC